MDQPSSPDRAAVDRSSREQRALPDLSQRLDYEWGTLDAADLGDDPAVALFGWLATAEQEGIEDFNSMALATVGPDGQPTIRNVLLRGIDDLGRLQFFTNRVSRKGLEMAASQKVGLLFSWLPIHRQVRVDGTAEPLGDAQSDEYFCTRPRGSRLSAWASSQSEVIADRSVLTAAMAEAERRFEGEEVTRPEHWGGYGVTPTSFEFWQGRPSRLHDRIRFRLESGAWTIERLAP